MYNLVLEDQRSRTFQQYVGNWSVYEVEIYNKGQKTRSRPVRWPVNMMHTQAIQIRWLVKRMVKLLELGDQAVRHITEATQTGWTVNMIHNQAMQLRWSIKTMQAKVTQKGDQSVRYMADLLI